MATSWRAPIFATVAVIVAVTTAGTASAAPPPAPGIEVGDDSGSCTAGFAAQGDDGSYYLLTSGHCDAGRRFGVDVRERRSAGPDHRQRGRR